MFAESRDDFARAGILMIIRRAEVCSEVLVTAGHDRGQRVKIAVMMLLHISGVHRHAAAHDGVPTPKVGVA